MAEVSRRNQASARRLIIMMSESHKAEELVHKALKLICKKYAAALIKVMDKQNISVAALAGQCTSIKPG